ncbi:MAG: NapC/NirT family cytochrome c [Rhodospirillaceae bacterium]
MAEHPAMKNPSLFARIWRMFVLPSTHYSLGAILLYGIGLGIVFWGGFHWVVELSNTETFCVSCHEHSAFTMPEVQASKHYSNVSGVRATCYDCHVPREWLHKLATKIYVSNELIHHFAGSMDSADKYEAKRQSMAQDVWRRMRETDSRECRNCHDYGAMNVRAQEGLAARQHELAAVRGVTCIECHMGLAHKLPPGVPERKLLTETK